MVDLPNRPGVLNGQAIRKALDHSNDPAIKDVIRAVDAVIGIYDGLRGAKESPDLTQTPEKRSLLFKSKHDNALQRAKEVIDRAVAGVIRRQDELEQQAYKNAAIAEEPRYAEEIRSTLRGLTQRDRDAALAAAVERGDSDVIAAVVGVPELLTGPLTVSRETILKLFVEKKNPGYIEAQGEIAQSIEHLAMVSKAFWKGAGALRDVAGEQRAQGSIDASEAADKRLLAATNGPAVHKFLNPT